MTDSMTEGDSRQGVGLDIQHVIARRLARGMPYADKWNCCFTYRRSRDPSIGASISKIQNGEFDVRTSRDSKDVLESPHSISPALTDSYWTKWY